MAISQKISPLQVSYAQSWSGLTTENHLYAIYQKEPQLASQIVTDVFSKMRYMGLDNFLSKYPTKIMDSDAEYRWMLKGDERRAIPIVSYTALDATRPGLNKSTFILTLAERAFEPSDFLILDDREYGVRIVDDGTPSGVNWSYTVQHMEPSDSFYIPAGLLAAGRKVSKQNNNVTNTLNKEYSGLQFTSHFEMRNEFSSLSQSYTVPGNMHDVPLLIKYEFDGKPVTVWTKWQEMVAEFQWNKMINNELMFAKTNKDDLGFFANRASNGFAIKRMAGLRQQISPSHKFYYTSFSIPYLREVLQNLSINILPEDQREFVILTGERGMYMFSEAVEDQVAIFQPLGDPGRLFGSGVSNLGFGGQYRQYMAYNGIKVTVMHMPEYDDIIDNRLEHPDGGYMENYRMTILNIGTSNGEPNIQKIKVKGADKKWYVAGSTTPFGPQSGGMGASKVDGYEMYRMDQCSIMLRNPLAAAELIPAVTTQY
jgi:hypothetical protein